MKRFVILLLISLFFVVVGTSVALFAADDNAAAKTESASGTLSNGLGTSNLGKFIGAGIAICGGTIGAGLGVGRIGSAAMGAISEKPELLGISMVFVAMAEGLSIIGFVVAFLILGSK
jgi:V/A-type H+-transporting ATPase subunit K